MTSGTSCNWMRRCLPPPGIWALVVGCSTAVLTVLSHFVHWDKLHRPHHSCNMPITPWCIRLREWRILLRETAPHLPVILYRGQGQGMMCLLLPSLVVSCSSRGFSSKSVSPSYSWHQSRLERDLAGCWLTYWRPTSVKNKDQGTGWQLASLTQYTPNTHTQHTHGGNLNICTAALNMSERNEFRNADGQRGSMQISTHTSHV